MNINLRQFVLLVMDAAGGAISGKTYLQKLCFFVGVKIRDSSLGFRPHYYGPYSDQLSAELSFLKSAGYISEQRRGVGFSDSSGWEVTRYEYSVTDEGRAAAESLKASHPDDARDIEEAVKTVMGAGKLDYMALSIAAKTYWIVNESSTSPISVNKIADQASSLKWKITPEQVEAATTFLEKLDLVTRVTPQPA
jgi:uncharacterized protein